MGGIVQRGEVFGIVYEYCTGMELVIERNKSIEQRIKLQSMRAKETYKNLAEI
jgi:hypothetical protein